MLEKRFWSKVNKQDGDKCWEWTAALFAKSGYGCFGWKDGKLIGAHRASWILTNGEITNGLWVLHKCDNRKCVRPDHLFLGTAVDNMRDASAKGRIVAPTGDANWMMANPGVQTGDKNFNAKLTAEIVAKIKIDLANRVKVVDISRKYNVSSPTISLILAGTNWANVPWPEGACFDIDCETANKARARRKLNQERFGNMCADNCGRPRDGTLTRCAVCWKARRVASKTKNASERREQERAVRDQAKTTT